MEDNKDAFTHDSQGNEYSGRDDEKRVLSYAVCKNLKN
jgi:hypothetical protein